MTKKVWLGEGWRANSLVDQRRLAKSQRKIQHIILGLVDLLTKQSSYHFSVQQSFFYEGGNDMNVSLKDVQRCSM